MRSARWRVDLVDLCRPSFAHYTAADALFRFVSIAEAERILITDDASHPVQEDSN